MLSEKEKQYIEMQQMTLEIGALKAGETTTINSDSAYMQIFL